MSRPLVIAHRGASRAARGNTADAFERAIEAGADMIEFDVRSTRDGELVAFHDPEVDGRPVDRLTRAEMTAAVGYEPLLLDDVLALAHGRIGVNAELKDGAAYVRRVLDAVRDRFAASDALVTAFRPEVVTEVRAAWPAVPAGLLHDARGPAAGSPASLIASARACGATALALEHAIVTRHGLDWAADADLDVYVWTVNDVAAIRALLAGPDVAGVITDVPEVAVPLRTASESAR
jgi:glycerophosphoryl diester phosphodiesterase